MTVDLTRLVKPLEWWELRDGNHREGECFSARSPVSFSPIAAHKKHDGWWLNVDCKTYPTLEAAQAAANADHAARVLAALDTALIEELVGAISNLWTEACANHDKPPPRKYMIPYGEIDAALAKLKGTHDAG